MSDQSLKDKTVKGTFWSAADAFQSMMEAAVENIVAFEHGNSPNQIKGMQPMSYT